MEILLSSKGNHIDVFFKTNNIQNIKSITRLSVDLCQILISLSHQQRLICSLLKSIFSGIYALFFYALCKLKLYPSLYPYLGRRLQHFLCPKRQSYNNVAITSSIVTIEKALYHKTRARAQATRITKHLTTRRPTG